MASAQLACMDSWENSLRTPKSLPYPDTTAVLELETRDASGFGQTSFFTNQGDFRDRLYDAAGSSGAPQLALSKKNNRRKKKKHTLDQAIGNQAYPAVGEMSALLQSSGIDVSGPDTPEDLRDIHSTLTVTAHHGLPGIESHSLSGLTYKGSDNLAPLTTIPKHVKNLLRLESLDLRNNAISSVPPSVCNSGSLREVDLRGNPLLDYAGGAGGLGNLELEKLRSGPDMITDPYPTGSAAFAPGQNPWGMAPAPKPYKLDSPPITSNKDPFSILPNEMTNKILEPLEERDRLAACLASPSLSSRDPLALSDFNE